MMVELNGRKMKTKESAHSYIRKKLKSKEYHGNNLDALWDVLSSYSKPIDIELKNKDKMIKKLGKYGESIIQVFKEAEFENDNIRFTIRVECKKDKN